MTPIWNGHRWWFHATITHGSFNLSPTHFFDSGTCWKGSPILPQEYDNREWWREQMHAHATSLASQRADLSFVCVCVCVISIAPLSIFMWIFSSRACRKFLLSRTLFFLSLSLSPIYYECLCMADTPMSFSTYESRSTSTSMSDEGYHSDEKPSFSSSTEHQDEPCPIVHDTHIM